MQIMKAPATMTSLELVDTINEVRAAEGKKPLRHANFMAKIEKHPAIDSPKYLGQYKDSTGRKPERIPASALRFDNKNSLQALPSKRGQLFIL